MSPNEHAFDAALIAAAMQRAEQSGWRRVTVVDAARDAALPLDEVRQRFPFRATVLLRLGILADQAALVDDGTPAGGVRERLFDMLMRRIDVLQQYRAGVRAVLRALPLDPPLAMLLAAATTDSIRWIAAAAGIDTTGPVGALRVKGVAAVWLRCVQAWDRDDSPDLSETMAALDKALDRAEWLAGMLSRPLFDRRGDVGDAEELDIAPDPLSEPPMPDEPLAPA
ncbi:MAG: TetR family transcriptional regulator [Gluconacetobacter diazotrophicus]|nr:TetR family transcriptional regulator [Gluconacetobacter diazotrophicus]